ncbi:MAG: hypothetical protein M3419_10410 [Actinomycetota bacterium]|nr:hypothetical protein [Actinomycetota bacterium]
MRAELEAYLSGVLGAFRVVGDLSRGHGNACVLEVVDINGRRWVAKRHRRNPAWAREVRAYRRWTPVLGDRAATLHWADRTTRSLVLSRVPGGRALNQPGAHQQAGQLLRALHRSAPEQPDPGFADRAQRRLDELLRRRGSLFDRREIDFVRGEIRSLRDLPTPASVPCHLD